MFRNTFLVFISTILLSFLFLSSCNETTILENKMSNSEEKIFKKDNEGGLLKETKEDVKIIGYKIIIENGKEKKVPLYDGNPNGEDDSKALPCNLYSRYVYELDHYEPKNGKLLGIWTNLKTNSELHNTYGFSQLFVGNNQAKINAISAGFSVENLMGSINFSPSSVNEYGYLKYYHLDEPIEHNAYPENIRFISQYVHDQYSNSLVMMSSYRSHLVIIKCILRFRLEDKGLINTFIRIKQWIWHLTQE